MADSLPAGFVTCVARVATVRALTARRRRLTLTHPAIRDMQTGSGPAPAVRLLIPPTGHPVYMPTVTPDGLTYPAGATPPTPRTFTLRRLDRTSGSLDVDIITGHDGLAAGWAAAVGAGDEVGVAGPKVFPQLPGASRYALLGDETAIPAIELMLERRWPGSSEVTAAIEAHPSHHAPRDDRLEWLIPDSADPGSAVIARLDTLVPHTTDVVVWVAGEASFARTVRTILQTRPTPPRHVRAAGYWRRSHTSTELDDQLLARTQNLIAAGADLTVLDEFALALPDRPGTGPVQSVGLDALRSG